MSWDVAGEWFPVSKDCVASSSGLNRPRRIFFILLDMFDPEDENIVILLKMGTTLPTTQHPIP
jgi:hypothetical protein